MYTPSLYFAFTGFASLQVEMKTLQQAIEKVLSQHSMQQRTIETIQNSMQQSQQQSIQQACHLDGVLVEQREMRKVLVSIQHSVAKLRREHEEESDIVSLVSSLNSLNPSGSQTPCSDVAARFIGSPPLLSHFPEPSAFSTP